MADEIFAIETSDVERAKEIVFADHRISARDALHVAVMERHNIPRIMRFDTGSDGLPKLEGLSCSIAG